MDARFFQALVVHLLDVLHVDLNARLVTCAFSRPQLTNYGASAGETSSTTPRINVHSLIASALHPFAESTLMIFGSPKWRIQALSKPFRNSVDFSLFNSLSATNLVASSQIVRPPPAPFFHLNPRAVALQSVIEDR